MCISVLCHVTCRFIYVLINKNRVTQLCNFKIKKKKKNINANLNSISTVLYKAYVYYIRLKITRPTYTPAHTHIYIHSQIDTYTHTYI